jgi:hypothetical protein
MYTCRPGRAFSGLCRRGLRGQCSFTVDPWGQAYTDSLGYLDTAKDPLVIQVSASTNATDVIIDTNGYFGP